MLFVFFDEEEMMSMCRLVPYKDGRSVADIKLDHINNISEQAKKTRHIDRIMLFGSSLEARCTEKSDIDIAVFGSRSKGRYINSKEFRDFKSNLFRFDWDQEYDVLYFRENTECRDPIMMDISQGVEIYRRAAG